MSKPEICRIGVAMFPRKQLRRVYESDEWEVDLARRELRARGAAVSIGKSRVRNHRGFWFSRPGVLVTKNDLMARVWPGRESWRRNTLQFHISAIRKALGPDRGMLKTGVRSWLSPNRFVDAPAGERNISRPRLILNRCGAPG